MNPERPWYSMPSESQKGMDLTISLSYIDTDEKEQDCEDFKTSQGQLSKQSTDPVASNIAPCQRKQERIILEKYMPVFFTDHKLDNSKCVICMNELEDLCPSCEEKDLQAAKASLQNPCTNVVGCCQITWGECTHVFHDHCLQKWFDQSMFKKECPLDRQPFIVAKQKD